MPTEPIWPSVAVPEKAWIPEVEERLGRRLQAEAPIQELHHLHLCHRATYRVLLGLQGAAGGFRPGHTIPSRETCHDPGVLHLSNVPLSLQTLASKK